MSTQQLGPAKVSVNGKPVGSCENATIRMDVEDTRSALRAGITMAVQLGDKRRAELYRKAEGQLAQGAGRDVARRSGGLRAGPQSRAARC